MKSHQYQISCEEIHMTRDELIDWLGEDNNVKVVVECEDADESLIVGPLIEKTYGCTVTDWDCGYLGTFWKYMFLQGGHVNAYKQDRDPLEIFGSATYLPACDFLRIIEGYSSVEVGDLL